MLVYFLSYGKEQEVHKCIHPNHFRVSGIKISNVVTKETSQILGTLSSGNADGDADAETGGKIGERTPL